MTVVIMCTNTCDNTKPATHTLRHDSTTIQILQRPGTVGMIARANTCNQKLIYMQYNQTRRLGANKMVLNIEVSLFQRFS